MEMIYASFINSLSQMQAQPPRARFDWRHKAGSASLQTDVYNYFLHTIFVAFLVSAPGNNFYNETFGGSTKFDNRFTYSQLRNSEMTVIFQK